MRIDRIKITQFHSKELPQNNNLPAANGYQNFLYKEIYFNSKLSDTFKENFYLEFSSMLGAGLDMRSALDIIASQNLKKRYSLILQRIREKVIAGESLSESIRATGKFTDYEIFSLQMGEETAGLPLVMNELAKYFAKRIKQRRQLIGALIYPLTVLVVAFFSILFMITYVVPMFADIFHRSGEELPAATKLVVWVSDTVRHHFFKLITIPALLILVAYTQRKQSWMKKAIAHFLNHLPLWGGLIKKIYLAQLCHTMAMLLGAKISLLKSLQLSRQIIHVHHFRLAIEQLEHDVIRGISLSDSIKKIKIFPPKFAAMIKVGEEVNQLDVFFRQLADQYSNEVEHQSSVITRFIEPLTIIILGLVVGVILIAMYLPLFKLGGSFS